MSNAQGVTPSRNEIERQLERMLAAPLFQARPKQADVFAFLVRSALDAQTVTELRIQKHCFPDPPYDPEASHVRTNVSSIRRELLPDYYAGDGEDDPVVIALPDPAEHRTVRGRIVKLPPGKAYTPSFRYNPRAWVAKELSIAHHLLRGSPAQIEKALEHLTNVGRAEPDHPEVMLGHIEAWGVALMLKVFGEVSEEIIAGPLWWIKRIEKQEGRAWRTHALRALLHYGIGDAQAAGKEFDKALELDRQATISRGWYVHFLFHNGHEEQAVRLMAMQAEERADSAPMHAMHGIYLTRAHRHEEAQLAFSKSLMLDRNCWPAHYGLTQMYLELGDREKAGEHAKRLETLVEHSEFEDMMRRLTPPPRPDRGR